jgi:hypothetical protein
VRGTVGCRMPQANPLNPGREHSAGVSQCMRHNRQRGRGAVRPTSARKEGPACAPQPPVRTSERAPQPPARRSHALQPPPGTRGRAPHNYQRGQEAVRPTAASQKEPCATAASQDERPCAPQPPVRTSKRAPQPPASHPAATHLAHAAPRLKAGRQARGERRHGGSDGQPAPAAAPIGARQPHAGRPWPGPVGGAPPAWGSNA